MPMRVSPAPIRLSKSRLIAHRQCPKRLWLQTYRPELADESATVAVMAQGNVVGEVARSLHPGGVLIDTDDLGAALRRTQAVLAEAPKPVFEATFQAADVLVRVDLLLPAAKGYRLAEVKSSTSVKGYHLDDAAIQTWVAMQAGIHVDKTEIAHINNRFIYPGEGCYQGLLSHQDVSDEVAVRLPCIAGWVREAQTTLHGAEPAIDVGPQCEDPFVCPFVGHCQPQSGEPEYPVSLLPRNRGLAATLKGEGYADLREVPEDRLSNPKHQKVWRLTRDGRAEVTEEGQRIARSLPYPRYYLDFESIAFAVPRWSATRPYQQVPFQFSCHLEVAPGELTSQAFLATDGSDPRRALALALIEAANPAGLLESIHAESSPGPVLVYSAGFERTRIAELADSFPDLADALLTINTRIVDLRPIAEAHYYHPAMKGSWSLKRILPTVDPALGYDNLEVGDGEMAQQAYLAMIDPAIGEDRKHALREDLLNYCARDTYGLVRFVEFLASGGVTP